MALHRRALGAAMSACLLASSERRKEGKKERRKRKKEGRERKKEEKEGKKERKKEKEERRKERRKEGKKERNTMISKVINGKGPCSWQYDGLLQEQLLPAAPSRMQAAGPSSHCASQQR